MNVLLILPLLVLAAGAYLLPAGGRARRSSPNAVADPPIPGLAGGLESAPRPGLPGTAPTVSVVIPALDEEGSIGWVLEHIPSWVSEVILVDGLSNDQTEAIARLLWPGVVVVHQRQPGKGAALRAGFAAATSEIVVMIDADGSMDPQEMHQFVDGLEAGADFVKGSRHLEGGGSLDFTPIRLAGNRGFVLLANVLYRQRFTDLCYGYCAFWRHHLDALALTADGFEIETQLVLNAVKARLRVAEVPSVELERRAGSSNLHAFKDGQRVLRTMVRGRRARTDARRAPVFLLEVEIAAHDSGAWLPAKQDRRRSERRQVDRPGTPDGVLEDRRVTDRRTQPAATASVYRVTDAPEAPAHLSIAA